MKDTVIKDNVIPVNQICGGKMARSVRTAGIQ